MRRMIEINLLRPEKKDVSSGPVLSDLAPAAPGAGGAAPKGGQLSIPAIVAALVLVLGAVGIVYVMQQGRLEEREKVKQERQARTTQLDEVLRTLSELEHYKQELDRMVAIIQSLKDRQKDGVVMMDQLSAALPEWVWFTGLIFKGDRLELEGRAMSNNLIYDLITNLKGTNHFSGVQILYSNRVAEGGGDLFAFKIQCVFRNVTMHPPAAAGGAVPTEG